MFILAICIPQLDLEFVLKYFKMHELWSKETLVSTPYGIGRIEQDVDEKDSHIRVSLPMGHASVIKSQVSTRYRVEFTVFLLKNEIKRLEQEFELSCTAEQVAKEIAQMIHIVPSRIQLIQPHYSGVVMFQNEMQIHELKWKLPLLIILKPDIVFERNRCPANVHIIYSGKSLLQFSHGSSTVIASVGFLTGIHFWEFNLDTSAQNVTIGVATGDTPLKERIRGTSGRFWGFNCGTGQKYYHVLEPYTSPMCVKGDRIGVLLNMSLGSITFYRNGESLGMAFNHIKARKLYPAVILDNPGLLITSLPHSELPK